MKSYLQIVAAMCIWSTWGLMIRWMALPPVVVLFYTSLIASFTVPLVLRLKGEFPDGILRSGGWHLFIGLALASLLNNLTYFYSLGHTTVSNAVFTHYTAPIIVAVLAPLVIAERLERVTIIALPVAVAGMALIVLHGGGLRLDNTDLPGILAGTASGFGYAFMILITRQLGRMLLHQKAVIILLWLTVLFTAPVALLTEYRLDGRTTFLLILTGIFHSTMAPIMYFSALRHVLAQHAAILGYIEPLAAVPLAFLFLAELPPLAALAGGALILLSGYMVVHTQIAQGSRS